MKKVLCATLMIVAALPGVALAQAGQRGEATARAIDQRIGDVGDFDVAGVRLGMTFDQAKQTLTARGFRVSEEGLSLAQDFNNLVRLEAGRLRQPVPAFRAPSGQPGLVGTDSDGNRIEVRMISLKAGSIVTTVELEFSSATNDLSSLPGDILKKYGTPTQASEPNIYPVRFAWCNRSVAPASCSTIVSDASGAHLSFDGAWRKLILTDSQARQKQRDAEIAAMFAAPTGDRQRSLLGS